MANKNKISDEKRAAYFMISGTFILIMIITLNQIFTEAMPENSFMAAFLSGFVFLLIIALCYLLFPSFHKKMKKGGI